MAKYLLALLTCFFSSFFSYSQDTTLQRLLAAKDDTNKVKRLAEYAPEVLTADPQKFVELANQIIAISKRLNYNNGIAHGLTYLGYYDNTHGNYRGALKTYAEAADYYAKSNNVKGVSKCYGEIANAYDDMNFADSSIHFRMKAIKLLEGGPPTRNLAFHYYNLAAVFSNRLGTREKALEYYRKAESIARQAKDTFILVQALKGVSRKLAEDGKLAEAQPKVIETLELSKRLNDNSTFQDVYENYAWFLFFSGHYKAAVAAGRQSLHYAKLSEDPTAITMSAVVLGKALNKTGDYQEQRSVLQEALQKGKGTIKFEMLKDLYEGLAEANYQLKNYKEAHDFRLLNALYLDSAKNEKSNKAIAELEARFQTAQKERTISEKQLLITQKDLQLQRSRQYIYYSLSGLVVVVLLLSLLYLNYRNKKQAYKRQLQAIQQEKEIQLLQALMQGEEKERSRIAKDLHDGVAGMLAAVKMHITSFPSAEALLQKEEGFRQGVHLLNEATQEVRKTSHNLMPEVLQQHGLDAALRRYCANISNSQVLQIQYDSWGGIDRFVDSFELSVYRIVQELLNNILKHSRATEALVQLSQQEEVLSISIEDNGVGFQKEGQGEGMGLRSLQSRIRAMNGKMDLQTAEQSGVSAYLEFDIADRKKELAALYDENPISHR